MVEVAVCQVKLHDWGDEQPARVVVVEGCAECKAADDSLVESMGGDESWRLPRAQRLRGHDG